MKTEYYSILYRPRGSLCWTPVPSEALPTLKGWNDDPSGNFFASLQDANIAIHALGVSPRSRTWMAGLKQWAPLQFTLGYVCTADDPEITTAPDPSPNLKPPR